MTETKPDQDAAEREELKALRKRASMNGLILGALSLMVGALVCLIYLLVYKPYKFH